MNSEHISSAFDRDLENIQAQMLRMGGLAEAAMRDAITALETGDLSVRGVHRGCTGGVRVVPPSFQGSNPPRFRA